MIFWISSDGIFNDLINLLIFSNPFNTSTRLDTFKLLPDFKRLTERSKSDKDLKLVWIFSKITVSLQNSYIDSSFLLTEDIWFRW